jgi:hypothetical protein
MANQDEMNGLEAGQILASLPIDGMISSLGIGIAKAQRALDMNAIETAVKLAEMTLDFPALDAQGNPTTLSRSLLSLGFTPTFYQFTEATLDLKIEMSVHVEESKDSKVSANASATKGPVAVGGTVSADASRKYGADSSAMTAVHLNLVAVPPPGPFLEYIRQVNAMQERMNSASAALPTGDADAALPETGEQM